MDQAFAAIQEAEVADAENAEVWVQVGDLSIHYSIPAKAEFFSAWSIS